MAPDGRHTDGVAVSVVLPARNAAATISEQLAAIAAQDHTGPVELIVADNGSTDDTADVAGTWRARVPGLRVVRADGRAGVAHARNVGFAEAANDLVLVCDADDVVTPTWIASMIRAIGDADMVGGSVIHWRGGPPLQDEPLSFGRAGLGFLDSFVGCNFGVRRAVWRALGGFDESFSSCEDIDFAWRAQLAGYHLVTAPEASVHYRIDARPARVLQKWFHYGLDQPALYSRFASVGMPRQPLHRALGRDTFVVLTSYRLLTGSTDAKERWCQEAGRRAGRLAGSIRHGVLFL